MFGKNTDEITSKDINELVLWKKVREGQHLDYKREFHRVTREFAKDTTAFANADGGYIIYGVDEKEMKICGVRDKIGNAKIEDWISNAIQSNIENGLNYEIKFIEVNEENEPLFIVVLYIKESLKKPVYIYDDKRTDCYLRKGSSVLFANSSEIGEMYLSQFTPDQNPFIQIKQKSKGSNNLQVGVNKGTIIKTDKIVKQNKVVSNPEIHISQKQAKIIKDKIDEIVEIYEQAGKFKVEGDKGRCFAQTRSSFYKKFGLTTYLYLPKEDFDEALSWLQKQISFNHRPKLRKGNPEQWQKKMYTSIYARAQSVLHLDKEGLYKFAYEKLRLKKPITSLKELSDVRLQKLYNFIFG